MKGKLVKFGKNNTQQQMYAPLRGYINFLILPFVSILLACLLAWLACLLRNRKKGKKIA